jgi:hypothetical protein
MRVGFITSQMFGPARFLAVAGGVTPTNLTLSGGEKYEESIRVTSIRRPLHRGVPFVTPGD